jgi:ABC-type transport system involved in cytochrome bd biosynthesis fused ATPase/permease subunit
MEVSTSPEFMEIVLSAAIALFAIYALVRFVLFHVFQSGMHFLVVAAATGVFLLTAMFFLRDLGTADLHGNRVETTSAAPDVAPRQH